MKLLLIEDNREIAQNLFDYLEPKGYILDWARDGITGLTLAVTTEVDLIVLDLMLPGLNGLEVCSKLRREAHKTTPVLMLTARDMLDDKIAGFNVGADDYLIKPFELKELEVRLRALLKRARPNPENAILKVADLEYDLSTRQVRRAGQRISLPPTALKILEHLMRESHRVVSRAELEQSVWDDDPPGSDPLRTHLHALRQAIDKPFASPLLHNLHGLGYRLSEHDDV